MRRLYTGVILLSAWLLAVGAWPGMADANADLPVARAELDTTAIYQDQTAILTLEIDGQHAAETPDFTPLQPAFEVVGVNFGARLRIQGGRVRTVSQWAIHLAPTRSGRLTVAPLTIAGHRSPALHLEVRAVRPQQRIPARLETELTTPPAPYVQAQLRYTQRLLYSGRLLNHNLAPPVIDHAIVQPLGDDRRYSTERDGIEYRVIEQRYAVFAERSGPLTVPAPRASCRVIQPSAENMPPQHLYFELTGEPRRVTIQPRPADYAGRDWLPAAALSVSERWPEPATPLRVGEPVVRVLSLTAKGLRAVQLPEFPEQKLAWAHSYPEQPHNTGLERELDAGQWLTHRREQRITLIPTQAGSLTLPAIEFSWWDTTNNKPQIASLPAKIVTVLPAATTSTATAITAPLIEQVSAQADNDPIAMLRLPWHWLTWLLALAWLATVTGWWLDRRHHKIHWRTSP